MFYFMWLTWVLEQPEQLYLPQYSGGVRNMLEDVGDFLDGLLQGRELGGKLCEAIFYAGNQGDAQQISPCGLSSGPQFLVEDSGCPRLPCMLCTKSSVH